MKNYKFIFLFFSFTYIFAQSDTTKYQWPIPNFHTSKNLNATFGEFRNTGNVDHFHNAVDVGEPDGNPIYPCIDGTIASYRSNGYNSYINVKSIINGKKKHITYYHIEPSPSLFLGKSVQAGKTIIGTVADGSGHVHLIEYELTNASSSSYGNRINPVRPKGGLNPYVDNYAPVINKQSLKFFKDNTSIEIPKNQLTGKVDIRIDVRERNGTSSSHTNNGTYILGYRILSEDGNTTIYEPKNAGMKYRFYFIPNDSYVHKVFVKNVATLSDPIYWLTNGNGEAYMNQNLSVPNNYLDTDLLDEGNYLLEIFSEDTRANKTSRRFPISVIKLPPELKTVLVNNDSISFSWKKFNSNSLIGYRIYYSNLNSDNWNLVADETTLNSETTEISFGNTNEFIEPTESNSLKFYLTAIDSLGIESAKSDTYSAVNNETNAPKLLIVDGFDRYGGKGSWKNPNHTFNTIYSQSVQEVSQSFNISSVSNEVVINEEIELTDFNMVIWFLGDESKEDNTFINIEQYKLALYLESGGKLLVSGEDIGQDLDISHSYSEFTDTLFFHKYLKANLIHDGLDILFEVNGAENTNFEGMNIQFGQTYPVDAPDDIEPINGAEALLNYTYERDGTYRKGGIGYKGTFGESAKQGALVYLSFPFETIGDEDSRNELMRQIQLYLGFDFVDVKNQDEQNIITEFKLEQNYPNPFNPVTTIRYSVPQKTKNRKATVFSPNIAGENKITIKVYDVLGREIKTLVNKEQISGNYQIEFDATNLTSGVYYYQLRTKNFVQTKKMILIK